MKSNESTLSPVLETQLERCQAYVAAQLRARQRRANVRRPPPPGPALTISHQTGSGGHEIAALLAGLLQAGDSKGVARWTVFDRQLVDKVLEEHHLPRSLAALMPEDLGTDSMMAGVFPE